MCSRMVLLCHPGDAKGRTVAIHLTRKRMRASDGRSLDLPVGFEGCDSYRMRASMGVECFCLLATIGSAFIVPAVAAATEAQRRPGIMQSTPQDKMFAHL